MDRTTFLTTVERLLTTSSIILGFTLAIIEYTLSGLNHLGIFLLLLVLNLITFITQSEEFRPEFDGIITTIAMFTIFELLYWITFFCF